MILESSCGLYQVAVGIVLERLRPRKTSFVPGRPATASPSWKTWGMRGADARCSEDAAAIVLAPGDSALHALGRKRCVPPRPHPPRSKTLARRVTPHQSASTSQRPPGPGVRRGLLHPVNPVYPVQIPTALTFLAHPRGAMPPPPGFAVVVPPWPRTAAGYHLSILRIRGRRFGRICPGIPFREFFNRRFPMSALRPRARAGRAGGCNPESVRG